MAVGRREPEEVVGPLVTASVMPGAGPPAMMMTATRATSPRVTRRERDGVGSGPGSSGASGR